MDTVEIVADGKILARHIPASAAWGRGLQFFSPDEDYVQVGTWGYSTGKSLLPHSHNEVSRSVLWTQEVLYIRKGRLRADIFDQKDHKVAELIAESGDILILLHGGHGYEILEDDTEVLEIKNGPYVGAENDRRRLE